MARPNPLTLLAGSVNAGENPWYGVSKALNSAFCVSPDPAPRGFPQPSHGSATVTLSYCYDALNRLTSKAYTARFCPMSSPVATYSYDQTACLLNSSCSNVGRRTGMTDQAGSEAWSYDSMGRVATDRRTTNGVTFNTSYTYNLDGSIATETYPDLQNPLVVTFHPGGAGRPVAEDSGDASYAYSVHYTPNGTICYWKQNWGSTTTANRTFNNRSQIARIYESGDTGVTPPTPCTNPTTQTNLPMDFTYSYTDANGHNDGNVASITKGGGQDFDDVQKFAYDSLNRISSAQTVAINQPDWSGDTTYLQECWGEQFRYDPWGNLLSISPVSSSYTGCTQENLSLSVNTRNQVNATGYVYDSAGNLISAPPTGTTYIFDAENHLVSAGGQTYIYDGDGKRVEKASSSPLTANKLYWYDQGGDVIYETDRLGNELYRYFRFQGILVTREEANDWVDHYGVDALGNVRWLYATNGGSPYTVNWDLSDYYPFGGERVIQANSNNSRKFTSKERDPESGNDYFGARFYSSSLGRFMSPDGPLADQHPEDPQSWNLYPYARNNPLRFTDADGRACVQQEDGSFKTVGTEGQSCEDAEEEDEKVNPSAIVTPSHDDQIKMFAEDIGNIGTAELKQDVLIMAVGAAGVVTDAGIGILGARGAVVGRGGVPYLRVPLESLAPKPKQRLRGDRFSAKKSQFKILQEELGPISCIEMLKVI